MRKSQLSKSWCTLHYWTRLIASTYKILDEINLVVHQLFSKFSQNKILFYYNLDPFMHIIKNWLTTPTTFVKTWQVLWTFCNRFLSTGMILTWLYILIRGDFATIEYITISLLSQMRLHIRSTFQTIVKSLVDSREKQKDIISKPAAPVKRHCYKQSVTKFRRGCGNLGMVSTFNHLLQLAAKYHWERWIIFYIVFGLIADSFCDLFVLFWIFVIKSGRKGNKKPVGTSI